MLLYTKYTNKLIKLKITNKSHLHQKELINIIQIQKLLSFQYTNSTVPPTPMHGCS